MFSSPALMIFACRRITYLDSQQQPHESSQYLHFPGDVGVCLSCVEKLRKSPTPVADYLECLAQNSEYGVPGERGRRVEQLRSWVAVVESEGYQVYAFVLG